MRISLLVIDDEKPSHELIRAVLSSWGEEINVVHAHSPGEALAAAQKESFHLALVDLHYKGGEPAGFSLLTELREVDPNMELLVVSSAAEFSAAQRAMRAGASDFVAKGFGKDELFAALRRGLERRRWRLLERRVREASPSAVNVFSMVGNSPSFSALKADLRKIAGRGVPVLLEGETGTGKEVAARALHQWGQDPAGPFVAVNCAAVPAATADSYFFGHERGAFTGAERAREGVFEEADGGTLFLDEVNSLSLDLQGRLLRVLQEKEVRRMGSQKTRNVDFRLVTATNQALPALVKTGAFREDLFYRIGVLTLKIPSLRDRAGDLENLVEFFVPSRQIEPELLALLRSYQWPGNVRELKNVMQALDAMAEPGEALAVSHLPEHTLRNIASVDAEALDFTAFTASQEEREKEFLVKAYRSCRGNVSGLARMLGADRSHLHQKLTRMGIHKPAT